MGDVADSMLDGTFCQECGVFLDSDPPGHPRYCEDCKEDQSFKEDQRIAATQEFESTRKLAATVKMTLKRHTDIHYSLRHPNGWILHIYPGNQRLYSDRNHPQPPFLRDKIPHPWTLQDVISAIIKDVT